MVKYPIGIQTFEKIREDGFLYLDTWAVAAIASNAYGVIIVNLYVSESPIL